MITVAAALVGVVGMLFILATSDPQVRAQMRSEFKAVFHVRKPYPARHRQDGSGAPSWKAVTA